MASPANLTIENASASKTGLVTSVGSQRSWRSYGTVKDSSPRLQAKSTSFLVHSVQEGDTLQGLALKYDVTVHQIQKLNNLWGSESILSRTELKIPFVSRSLTSSPIMSRAANRHGNHSKDKDRKASSLEEVRVSDGSEEEVKRKPLGVMAGSAIPSNGGEKTIASVLDSADQQLRISREFAEKLARRSAALKMPADAYNRGRSPQKEGSSGTPSSSRESSVEMDSRQQLPSSSSKRRKKAAENVSQTREQVENDIFEL